VIRADRGGCIAGEDGFYGEQGKECPVDYYCYQGKLFKCRPGFSTNSLTSQGTCAYVKAGYYYGNSNAIKCPVGTYSDDDRLRDEAESCDEWCVSGGGRGVCFACFVSF